MVNWDWRAEPAKKELAALFCQSADLTRGREREGGERERDK
jgi:hypothetical protein